MGRDRTRAAAALFWIAASAACTANAWIVLAQLPPSERNTATSLLVGALTALGLWPHFMRPR